MHISFIVTAIQDDGTFSSIPPHQNEMVFGNGTWVLRRKVKWDGERMFLRFEFHLTSYFWSTIKISVVQGDVSRRTQRECHCIVYQMVNMTRSRQHNHHHTAPEIHPHPTTARPSTKPSRRTQNSHGRCSDSILLVRLLAEVGWSVHNKKNVWFWTVVPAGGT